MAARRKVDPAQGAAMVRRWYEAHTAAEGGSGGAPLTSRETRLAVLYTLEELAAISPGGSVEVRVPPAGAVQAIAGTQHRRGTPPAVVETDPTTWLRLAVGELTWQDALTSGAVRASGQRTDLAPFLPLERPSRPERSGVGTVTT